MPADSAEQSHRPSHMARDRVAICVCTKDRSAMFLRCFQSLLDQEVQNASLALHLIVVDNSADANERLVVARYQDVAIPVLYVHEPSPGIPNARNAALTAALSLSPDWIAFIDDDEIAPMSWIARLHTVARTYDADVCSGMVVQFAEAAEARESAARWEASKVMAPACVRRTCPTSNVIFRTWLIDTPCALRFDEAMRHGGSDNEFFMRAFQRKARIIAVKDAPVFEEYPADRQTLEYECRRAFRVGATYNYRYTKNFGKIIGSLAIVARAGGKVVEASFRALGAVLRFPFSRTSAKRDMRRSIRGAVFVFGCIAPAFGIKTDRYW